MQNRRVPCARLERRAESAFLSDREKDYITLARRWSAECMVLTLPWTPPTPEQSGHFFSRYPVLKIHHTAVRHAARNTSVIVKLTPTDTSALP